ncbi:ribonuclease P [Candidatus Woesearchaeota archaeon]|nr:ribonuclease P [Candidatus Woesearchaeota archaeon]
MIPKSKQKQIAKERIETLFNEAKKSSKNNLELANRYVTLARKISMKYKVKIPLGYKRFICKYCYSYLIPGRTLRARVKNKKLIYYCTNCKKIKRYPFSKR